MIIATVKIQGHNGSRKGPRVEDIQPDVEYYDRITQSLVSLENVDV